MGSRWSYLNLTIGKYLVRVGELGLCLYGAWLPLMRTGEAGVRPFILCFPAGLRRATCLWTLVKSESTQDVLSIGL